MPQKLLKRKPRKVAPGRARSPSAPPLPADFGGRSAKVKKAIEQFKTDGEFAPLEHYLPSDLAQVPRNRLRVCEAAVQLDFFSQLWQQPYRTVGEALMDLSDESTDARYKNHNPPHHNAIVSGRMAYIPEGGKMDVKRLPPELAAGVKTKAQVSNYSKVFYRLSRKRPAPTVVPGHNAFPVHPTLNRTLTVREAAR